MTRWITGAVLLVAALTMIAPNATADEELKRTRFVDELDVSVDLGVYSAYVWRGILTVDDWVFQPSIDVSAYGLSLNVWGNMDLTDENGEEGEFTEVDYTASYTISLCQAELSLGVVHYHFPTLDDANTTEIFLGVAIDVPLSPSVTVYRDVDQVKGTYVAFGVGHTFEKPFGICRLAPEVSLSVAWACGRYNEFYYGARDAGLADLTVGLKVPFQVTTWASIWGSVHYSALLTESIRDASDDPDNVWFGFGATFSF